MLQLFWNLIVSVVVDRLVWILLFAVITLGVFLFSLPMRVWRRTRDYAVIASTAASLAAWLAAHGDIPTGPIIGLHVVAAIAVAAFYGSREKKRTAVAHASQKPPREPLDILQDLANDRVAGKITPEEYDRARANLMRGVEEYAREKRKTSPD